MGRWSLGFTRSAEEDLAQLDRPVRRRIIDKLEWLSAHFDGIIPSALHAEFREFYKLRVGDWRVVYKIEWRKYSIMICYIDRRDRVYKKGR
ncbi:MAG: type II toxin-antitoxin system RelE/ParE family toxin [Candidatus Brennerbacteria bacterium]|nr:type II toxin-antitoxin system RelE/ParE family toxin [Candidatus Brennerbacteria bacterium]